MHVPIALIGLWPLIAHYGLGILGVAVLALLAFYSPVFKDGFVGLAFGLVLALIVYTVGVHDADKRIHAQEAAVQQRIDRAIAQAKGEQSQQDQFDQRNLDVPKSPAPSPRHHAVRKHWVAPKRVRHNSDPWDGLRN